MRKITREEYLTLRTYTKYVNGVGDPMEQTAQTSTRQINSETKFRYILGIMFGTEILKAQLRGLIALDDLIIEMKKLKDEKGDYSVKSMKDYEKNTYGSMADLFYKRYDIQRSYPELYNMMVGLNKKRNEIIHDAIFLYKGDIERAEQEIRLYMIDQPINQILHELVTILNIKREDNVRLNEELKEMGII